jgi:hypothetical protein
LVAVEPAATAAPAAVVSAARQLLKFRLLVSHCK